MNSFKRLSEHVFDGAGLPPDADPKEVATLRAVRDALKSMPTPDCRLTTDHLRSAILDAAANRRRRPVVAWAFPVAAVAAALAWLAVPRSHPEPAAPALVLNEKPASVAPSAAVVAPPPIPEAAPRKAEPVAAATPGPKRTKRAKQRAPAAAPPVLALVSARAGAADAASPSPVVEASVPTTTTSEEVVIVQEPVGAVGAAVEVELGQEVVFGG